MDLPKLIMFIDEECGNLIDSSRTNNRNTCQKFYKPIDVHSVTNAIDEIGVNIVFLVVAFFVGR